MSSDDKNTHIDKWLIIPKLILGANICIAAFGAVTLFREIRKL
jgi:hypothetical protein